jgi:hypothetical protein
MSPDIDGVLGISPRGSGGSSFVKGLLDSGVIGRQMVSLYLSNETSFPHI